MVDNHFMDVSRMARHPGTLPMPFSYFLLLMGVILIVTGAVAVTVRPMSGRKKRTDGGFNKRDVLRD